MTSSFATALSTRTCSTPVRSMISTAMMMVCLWWCNSYNVHSIEVMTDHSLCGISFRGCWHGALCQD